MTIEGIAKRFRPHWVLRDVGFSVQQGEVLGLIGPNGAGKTTLLECIAGLLAVAAGDVQFAGRRLLPVERKESLYYLPDGILPFAEQPHGWVLKFFAGIYQRSIQEIGDLIETLKLQSLLKARIRSLSKGERERALLAFALLTSQPLLLLDEPFDGLDLRQTRNVMKLLRDYAARGRTLLLSIYQLTDAERVCDRFILLSGGKGKRSHLNTTVNCSSKRLRCCCERVFTLHNLSVKDLIKQVSLKSRELRRMSE